MIYVVESPRDFASLSQNIRNAISGSELNVPVKIYSLGKVVSFATFTQRVPLYMITFFGLIALIISALGIYGLVSYSVEGRSKEFGIRMALGALPKTILKRVLAQNVRLIALATVIGIVASAILFSGTRSLFPEINPLELSNFISVSFFVFVIAMSAVIIPALRIIKINLTESLRCE